MTALWRWPELCRALGVPVVDGPDVGGIAIDSRRVRPGDLFFALRGDPGPRFTPSQRSDRDGHDFIDAAIAAGAVGVVAADGRPREAPQLQVEDTVDALWALGAAARGRLHCPIVAVTGSSGKTTVKGFLAAALDAFAAPGSLNNHLGVPLSLASTPRDASAAVYEIGTNHEGEIAPLSRLVRPDVAVVLNVHPAHRENFPSMAALTREKLSIHEGLEAEGVLVLEESLDAGRLPETLRIERFGRGDQVCVRLLGVQGGGADYAVAGERLSARVPGGGEHRALSLAAVLCVLHVLGRDPSDAAALPDTLIVPGRGQELRGRITLIDDSYNANPESMKAALIALRARPERRRYALLGEMLELGEEGPAFHRALAAFTEGLDGVFCIGEGMRALFDALPPERRMLWQAAADEALTAALQGTLEEGDVLLVKGSNRVFWVRGYVKLLTDQLL
ncbi:MAG: UDP-N-acetylmuramoyl-tripeptide--D-alanyl-D-alanine ligase [Roseibium album]|uniref:UDP-N-acetylmuramoyl-tripeptide--D-alanyl-D- alanine ligase n=1 Tax=Roseibium album TaxID=311410 RepID=UPI0032EBE7C7